MPSFDVVSQVDLHEVHNAVDQSNREIGNRFDFKGTNAHIEWSDGVAALVAENEFQLGQMRDIFHQRLSKRGVDLGSLDAEEPELGLNAARQRIRIREGIDMDLAKQLVKRIKAAKRKVQAAIQGDQVRVTGKKRDDLQATMALLREADLDLPLQFINFRD